jgi:hypothetical protein
MPLAHTIFFVCILQMSCTGYFISKLRQEGRSFLGSLGVSVEGSRFGGVSVQLHAHTPKSGVPPRRFPESLFFTFVSEWPWIWTV